MSDWLLSGLEDDMAPRMLASAARGEPFALATVVAAEGGGPRGVGAQMVVTASNSWGFLSGGCVEADVCGHGREIIADGRSRRLVYGHGSPFLDIQLTCGGRLELLVERIAPDDPVLAALADGAAARRPVRYRSDGDRRTADADLATAPTVDRTYPPTQRLIVVGADPFALGTAALGAQLGWETTLVRPRGPAEPPPLPVAYRTEPAGDVIRDMRPDRWTAVACCTHDLNLDHDALTAALLAETGYVGVLGARRLLPERLARLKAAGVTDDRLAVLRAPIGLNIGGRAPWEVALSIVAEIVAERRHAG